MTIDERLEAIAQNLDLLTRIHLDNDREYRERFRQIEDLFQKNEERFQQNETRVGQLMDTMNRLGRIIEIHDQRLDDLEQR
jgi:hypothetical protein